jgi:hypothetical protein
MPLLRHHQEVGLLARARRARRRLSMTTPATFATFGRLLALPVLASALFVAACGDDPDRNPGEGGNGTGGNGSGNIATGGIGNGVLPPPPSCAAAEPVGTQTTQAPVLVASLADSWNEAWSASPAVADLDGDGTPEIIGSRSGRVNVWHADGTLVWQADVEGRCWSSPAVADFRADLPGLEVAQASGDKIYLFGADGAPASGFPYTWRGELRSLGSGDIDGDQALELVSVTTQNLEANGQHDIVIAVNPDGSTVAGFPPNTSGAAGCDDACYVYNGYDQNVAIGDVDGNGVSDIFATQDNAYNSLHNGQGRAFDCDPMFEGKTKFMGVRALHALAEAQAGWAEDESTALQGHHTNTAPAIADVDGDGQGELVYVASVQNTSQDNRLLGVALWALENDGTRVAGWELPLHYPDYLSGLWDYGETNIVAITNQVSVADIDPTHPGLEYVFAGFDGRIHAAASDQSQLWDVGYTQSDVVATGGVAIGDLSGDGSPEIVFATYSTAEDASALVILDSGGNAQQTVTLPGRGAMPVPTIADADGDGVLEIVVSLKDSTPENVQLLVYRVPGSSTNCLPWPTGRGSLLRDGYVPPG